MQLQGAEKIQEHGSSESHAFAMEKWMQLQRNTTKGQSVLTLLDDAHAKLVKENRHYLGCVIKTVLMCAKQGTALRGHRETAAATESDPGCNRGNFLSFLELVSEYDPIIQSRLASGPANAKYCHHSIQNDILHAAAGLLTEDIVRDIIQAGVYSLQADETRDLSKVEQLSLCLRYIKNDEIKESFINFTACNELSAAALCENILNTLRDKGVPLEGCIGQCYDGAFVMSGHLSGVQLRIKEHCPSAIYIHCFAHRLNLVVVDVAGAVGLVADMFGVLQRIHNFMCTSVVHIKFVEAQKNIYPNKRVWEIPSLSNTRWICRHEATNTVSMALEAGYYLGARDAPLSVRFLRNFSLGVWKFGQLPIDVIQNHGFRRMKI